MGDDRDIDAEWMGNVEPEPESPENELAEALARGDEKSVAKILRAAESIGQPVLDLIASLLVGFPPNQRGMRRRFPHRLKIVRRRGAPSQHDPFSLFSRDRKIAAFFEEQLETTGNPKEAQFRAEQKFGVGRTTVTDAIRLFRRKKVSSQSV